MPVGSSKNFRIIIDSSGDRRDWRRERSSRASLDIFVAFCVDTIFNIQANLCKAISTANFLKKVGPFRHRTMIRTRITRKSLVICVTQLSL